MFTDGRDNERLTRSHDSSLILQELSPRYNYTKQAALRELPTTVVEVEPLSRGVSPVVL